MKNFVDRRAASPQATPLNANIRRQIAERARVTVPHDRVTVPHDNVPTRNNEQQRRNQSNSTKDYAHRPQQSRLLNRQPSRDAAEKRDAYDTDADSIDTTIHSRSVVQIEDSQIRENAIGQEEEDYGDDEEDDSANQDSEIDMDQMNHEKMANLMKNDPIRFEEIYTSSQAVLGNGNHLEAEESYDSYPTTTSGNREDTFHEEGPHPESLHGINTNAPSRDSLQHKPPDRASRSSSVPPEVQQPSASHLLHQRGAALRQKNRSDNNLSTTVPPPTKEITNPQLNMVDPIPAPQPQRYSQFTQGLEEEDLLKPHIGHRNPRSNQRRPIETSHGAGPESVISNLTILPPNQQHENEDNEGLHDDEPIEDYDRPALFDLSYEQLQGEDFDHHPRGTPPVLSDEQLQKPLPERLEWVQHQLSPEDQHKFFGSLATSEWEDAGDWFLDQFGDVLKKFKQARQEKRKLAIEFEKEVGERNGSVAKRQKIVEKAMDSMKTHGQSLLPRSPRRTRELS